MEFCGFGNGDRRGMVIAGSLLLHLMDDDEHDVTGDGEVVGKAIVIHTARLL